MGRNRRRKPKWQPERALAGDLDRRGRALVVVEGSRPAHVDGALPGELVEFIRTEREGPGDAARVLEVLEPSPDRVDARCAHYGVCGGCSLMHMDPAVQIAFKQQILLADLEAHGLAPERVLEPLRGPSWRYRRRARLGAKLVPGKGKVVVGFREKDRRFIADLSACEVLAGPGEADELIPALSQLVGELSVAARTPQIEVSVGDDARAIVLRVLDPPSEADLERLRAFGRAREIQVFLQPGGLDSVAPLEPELADPSLRYSLPAFGIELGFRPTDFVQVNAEINRAMVSRVIELLEVEAHHRVLDLFCGLGNFSLALGRRAGQVLGIEADEGLVARARANAAANGLTNVAFERGDLYRGREPAGDGEPSWARAAFDRVLLDPPRSGAAAVVERFDEIAAPRVVYVACSPETLARDAATLVSRHGYRLLAAGVMDMFPHTAHVESIALLAR